MRRRSSWSWRSPDDPVDPRQAGLHLMILAVLGLVAFIVSEFAG